MNATKCKYCGDGVGFDNWEAGYDFCDWCADIEIERSRKKREWAEYHPGEPCPECELPPYRALQTTVDHGEGSE